MFDVLFKFLEVAKRYFEEVLNRLIPSPPPEVTQGIEGFVSAIEQVKSVSYIVPISAMGIALGIVSAGVLGGMAIKFFRIGASFATLGGGAA